MNFRTAICLVLLLGACLSARSQDWDEVLDRYELICSRCEEIKRQTDAGENVPQSAVTSILGQMSTIRTMLQDGKDGMTPAQKARFEQIRLKYAAALGVSTTVAEPSDSTEAPPDREMPVENAPEVEEKPVPSKETPTLRTDILVQAGVMPFSAGVMSVVTYGKWGGFFKLRSSFVSTASSYRCNSDKTIEGRDGGKFWPSGKIRDSRLSVSIGAVMMCAPWVSAYAGAGYGWRRIFWQDIEDNWAEVSDVKLSGADVTAGLLFKVGKVCFNAGVSTVNFRYADFETGIGVSF